MPSYDFVCMDCNQKVVLTFKSYAEYDTAEKRCPKCNSVNMRRSIKRVALAKSEVSRFSDSDDSTLDDLADADPATLGRYMRRLSDESGEDLGEEFNTIVERLEHGEDPEEIEQSLMPPEDALDADDDAGFGVGDESPLGIASAE